MLNLVCFTDRTHYLPFSGEKGPKIDGFWFGSRDQSNTFASGAARRRGKKKKLPSDSYKHSKNQPLFGEIQHKTPTSLLKRLP